MTKYSSILIIGGGIAGLVAAIRLRQLGLNVVVIEKAPTWTIAGAGMHLHSNALRALRVVGVVDQIIESGVVQDGYIYTDLRDLHEVQVSFHRFSGEDIPAFASIGRQTFHEILLDRAEGLEMDIRLGTTFATLSQTDESVIALFSNGNQEEFDLVIGCDGINSKTREVIFGRNEPVFTGQGIWRAIVDRHPNSRLPKIMYGGHGRMVGFMPIDERRVYLFAGMPDPDRPRYPPNQFHHIIKERFHDFGGLAPYYLSQIIDPQQVIYTAIEMVVQKSPWYRGRIFLIGDAVHASAPYLAQGAAMAIEDAIVLTELISGQLRIEELQRQFMGRRFERANFIQTFSIELNKERYQGGAYDAPKGHKSQRIIDLEINAQRHIDALYQRLAEPI